MSRYRPPTKPSSKYISLAGQKRLKEELRYLWKEERPIVTKAVSAAAAMGDRSENADYIYGKKRLHEIDRRVRYLRKRLDDVTVVDRHPDDVSRIFFGATVKLEDDQGVKLVCRLLGADEIDPKSGSISIDSPLGKAMLGKQVDAELEIETPVGTKQYYVLQISYD